MAKTPVAEQVQVNFRMPVDLRDRIKAAADANNRSMNAEIILALEEAFPVPERDLALVTEQVLEDGQSRRVLLGLRWATVSTDGAAISIVPDKVDPLSQSTRAAPKD